MNRRLVLFITAILLTIFVAACSQVKRQTEQAQSPAQEPAQQTAQQTAQQPTIEATPTEQSGQWKVIKSDNVTLSVTAPGAKEVKILYRPLVAEGRYIE